MRYLGLEVGRVIGRDAEYCMKLEIFNAYPAQGR